MIGRGMGCIVESSVIVQGRMGVLGLVKIGKECLV